MQFTNMKRERGNGFILDDIKSISGVDFILRRLDDSVSGRRGSLIDEALRDMGERNP